jgi:4-diphosphocytidyl-2-C-methyl-D-erythritol kinase
MTGQAGGLFPVVSEAATGALGFAPAKINLTLRVTGRRADGYHLLDSLVVFAKVGDRLSVKPAEMLSLSVSGPFGSGLGGEDDNLVLRAARALAVQAGIVPRGALLLDKMLPIASGIGGGSSDAAAALRLLDHAWSLRTPAEVMARIAVSLGADVPVCLDRLAMRMRGIGEKLTPVPALPRLGLVLANPGTAVATAAIFRARAGMPFSQEAPESPGWPSLDALVAELAGESNDLEAAAVSLEPSIGAVLSALRSLPGCRLARMSGSGATCFALFADPEAAAAAAVGLRPEAWWRWGGGLYVPPASAL